MRIAGIIVASSTIMLMLAQGAFAQGWGWTETVRPDGRRPGWQQQQQQQQQRPPQQRPVAPQGPAYGGGGGGGGACVPSGFARLSRNCSVNTGACQRMPDSCNRGWCCP